MGERTKWTFLQRRDTDGIHTSIWIEAFFKYIPRSGIAVLYDNSIFSFLRNLHTVLHSGFINLHSRQQCRKVLFLYILSSIYYLMDFLMMVILTGVKSYHIVVLICISLIISNVGHLFKCLFIICMSYLDLMPILQLYCFIYICTWTVCIFWILIPCWWLDPQIFSFIWRLSFCFVYGFLCCAKYFKSN